MFKFNDLKAIHLEISNNCQASCPMCVRNIHGGLENPLLKITNWSLEDFKTIMTPRVLNQLESFFFCGNYGDPMMNNDVIDMCRYAKEVNPNLFVHFHTNGGARKTSWWEELAEALPKNHRVVFAIDGLEDTHHLYRIGTKYETVIENARAFISAGGIAEWAFLKFLHNEHQTEEVRKRSKELGFSFLSIKNSSRFILENKFPVWDKNGSVTHYLQPSSETPIKFIDRKIIDNYKKIVEEAKIDCKVLELKEIYIDAFKHFYPCCWLGIVPNTYIMNDDTREIRLKMLKQHDEMLEKIGETNLLKRSIEEIMDSKEYQSIWGGMWHGTNKSFTCARICGNHNNVELSKSWEQYQEYNELGEIKK